MQIYRHTFAGCAERFLTWLGASEEGGAFRLPLPRGTAECTVYADHVVCTAAGERRVLPAAGQGAAGVLPVMKALGDLALVYVPFHVDLEAGPAPGPRNTALTYHYRVGDKQRDYQAVCTVVFAGVPGPGEMELLVAALAEGDNFVPGEVGLPDLQGPEELPWHEVLRVCVTDAPASDRRTFSEFADAVARHVLEQGWDEEHVASRTEVPVARPVARPMEA